MAARTRSNVENAVYKILVQSKALYPDSLCRFIVAEVRSFGPPENAEALKPSHNTGSPKLPASCGECQLWCICDGKVHRGDVDCLEARSQLRASA
jgi:hypothetical protein